MGVNSKSGPSVLGVHLSMIAPCGMYTSASRVPEFVAACAVMAGIIDSRNGNASVAPVPCKNVRRDRCFLVINIAAPSKHISHHKDTGGHGGQLPRAFRGCPHCPPVSLW